MCGIVGVIAAYQNGFTNDEQDAFGTMLFLDTTRGWDSTGTFLVTNTGNMYLKKAALHGPDFIRTSEYKNLQTKAWNNGMFMVGHNRAATRGTVSDQNAHPFCVEDKVVLVQNGTYVGSHRHIKDTEVDTEAVAYAIVEDNDIEKSLQRINAAYALVWWDFRHKTLNIIRNEQRPLFLAETADGGYMFASEIETLFYSASKAKRKFKGVPKLIEPGDHHCWKLDDKKHHEYTVTKLDYKYRYKSGETSDYNSEMAAWGAFYGQGGRPTRHEFHPVTVAKPTHIRQVVNNMNNRPTNEKSIFEYVQDNKFPDFAADQPLAFAVRDAYQSERPDTLVVEFIDYLPVVEGKTGDKARWFVYGKRVTPNPDDYSPLIYMNIEGDETTALDFTVNSLYTVEVPGGTVMHKVTPGRMEPYHILTMFSCNPVSVKLLEANENGSTH